MTFRRCPGCRRNVQDEADYCDRCRDVPPPVFDQYDSYEDDGDHDGGLGSGRWLERLREIDERIEA